jgi:hypothetical protein
MDFASGPNGTSRSRLPPYDVSSLLLTTALDTQKQLGRLAEGMETLQESASETREILSEIGEKVGRLDQRVGHLETRPLPSPSAPPPSAPSSPASSLGQITISVPAYHLAAMCLLAVLGLAGVLTGAETKQAMLQLLPKP